MRRIFPNLYLVHGGIGAGTSYLLKRSGGNFLLPSFGKAEIEDQLDEIEKLGGVSAIYVNGRHNAKSKNFPNKLIARYHPPIYLSEIDAKTIKPKLPNVQPLKFQRQQLADDLRAIPFPGYSKGGMAYLWENGGKKHLFVGITLSRIDGQWKTWLASAVTLQAFNQALKGLKDTRFDVLLCNSMSNTEEPWFTFTARQRNTMVDALLKDRNDAKP